MKNSLRLLAVMLGLGVGSGSGACTAVDDEGGGDDGDGCEPGKQLCDCLANNKCLGDLVCSDGGFCVTPDDGGENLCTGADGTYNCPCLADGSCLGEFVCSETQTCTCLGAGDPCGTTCVNLLSDNNNCGACDRVCTITGKQGDNGVCLAASCSPTYGQCFHQSTGFLTCEDYCGSTGESCVAGGCDGTLTLQVYGSAADCTNFEPAGSGTQACDEAILFENVGPDAQVRCCCTQP